MIRRPPRSTRVRSSAASDVYKRQTFENLVMAAVMGERNSEDSRRKSDAVRAGLARRRAAGKRVGGHSYGITWRRNDRDERETIADPEKVPVIERVYDEFLSGRALLQIARALNADE